MKKPTTPVEPRKPFEPRQPKEKIKVASLSHQIDDEDNLSTALHELFQGKEFTLEKLKDVCFVEDYDQYCDDGPGYSKYYLEFREEVENPSYKRELSYYKSQYKKYEKALEKYQEEMKIYRKKKKVYNELNKEYEKFAKQERIKWLQEELDKLTNLI